MVQMLVEEGEVVVGVEVAGTFSKPDLLRIYAFISQAPGLVFKPSILKFQSRKRK